MHQGARKYLAERLWIARDRPDGVELVEWRRQMLAGFGGATEALVAAGAMSSEEVPDWNNRMQVAVGLEPDGAACAAAAGSPTRSSHLHR